MTGHEFGASRDNKFRWWEKNSGFCELFATKWNLGLSLYGQKRYGEAGAALRTAIRLKPDFGAAYNHLGDALYCEKKLDQAETAYRKAIELLPTGAYAYNGLGNVLRDLKKLSEALAAYRTANKLLPKEPVIGANLRQTEQWIEFDKKSARVLSGEEIINDAQEQLEFALYCGLYLRAYRAAAKIFAAAFAVEPKLAEDPTNHWRLNAACCAALAAAGRGIDAAQLVEVERAELRKQALAWLRADLASWGKLLSDNWDRNKWLVRERMQYWQESSDLANVRDPDMLAKSPADEQERWKRFWADVEALRKQTESAK